MKKESIFRKVANKIGRAFKSIGVFAKKTFKNFLVSSRKIRKLLKLLLNNKYSVGSDRGWKKIITAIIKYVLIFGVILLVLWFILSRIIGYLAIPVNQELFAIVLLAILVISLISSVSHIIKTMYISKDNEILLSLPISFNELFLSKLIFLYINELVFNILYIGPILCAFGIIAKGGLTPMNFASFLLFFPIIPVATLGIGALISIPVMFLVRFLKDHNKVSIIGGLICVAGLFVLYMLVITNISGAFNIADEHIKTAFEVIEKIKTIGSNIPVFYWTSFGFFKQGGSIGRLFVFLAGSFGFLLITLPFIKKFFQKIAVFNNETKKVTRPKARKYVRRSPMKELFLNEFRTCLRSPSLIVQYFLFTILLPIIVVAYDKLLFSISVNQTGEALLFASHVLVLMMLTCLSSAISSVAISRQGGLVYISKMIPISYEKQAFIKISFNVAITWVAIIIGTITSIIFSTANVGLLIISGVAAMILSVGHVCQSYDIDLRRPAIDWYDVDEISSLSKNTTESILYGFLLAIIFTALTVVAKGNVLATALVLIIPAALYSLGRVWLIRIRLKFVFDEMEI